MKLYYEKKFYKDLDDETAQKIGEILVGIRRPYHIEVNGKYLKTEAIELRADDNTLRKDAPVPNNELKQFERKYDEWKAAVPPEERSWEFFAAVHNLITLHDVYLAPSGLKRCRNYSVIDQARFARFTRLYSAMQEHYVLLHGAIEGRVCQAQGGGGVSG